MTIPQQELKTALEQARRHLEDTTPRNLLLFINDTAAALTRFLSETDQNETKAEIAQRLESRGAVQHIQNLARNTLTALPQGD